LGAAPGLARIAGHTQTDQYWTIWSCCEISGGSGFVSSLYLATARTQNTGNVGSLVPLSAVTKLTWYQP
jgi:hypothetical protein